MKKYEFFISYIYPYVYYIVEGKGRVVPVRAMICRGMDIQVCAFLNPALYEAQSPAL